jgi:uncharacterized DUF497 family protein
MCRHVLRRYKYALTLSNNVSTLFLMEIEFDPAKNAKNVADRKLSLARAAELFKGRVFELLDERRDYGEIRRLAFGRIDGRLHVCVYTDRGEIRRIISLRKANAREKAWFDRQV